MKGYAPGWQVRCKTCGLTVDAGKAGIIRVWAVGKSYKLGWCSRCRRIRCLVVERHDQDLAIRHVTRFEKPVDPRDHRSGLTTSGNRLDHDRRLIAPDHGLLFIGQFH